MLSHQHLERRPAEPAHVLGQRAAPGVPDQLLGQGTGPADGLGQDLHLARSLHGHEPPRRLVHGRADGEQSVVLQDGRLAAAEASRDPLPLVAV